MPYDPAWRDTSSEGEPEKPRWYGWQTLATDGAALALVVLGATEESEGGDRMVGLGVGTYVLGGPVVHAVHRRAGAVFGSLGLRVGAPLVGVMGGLAIADCEHDTDDGMDFCGVGEAAIGFLLGVGTAVAVDAAVLAREPARDRSGERRQAARPRLSPGIAVTPERRTLVLSGTF